MADTTVLAMPVLFKEVVRRFGEEAPGTRIVFGWSKPPLQLEQGSGRANRVCFVPGNGPKAGSYGPARAPGRNPRPLRTMFETFTVYCWAVDATTPFTLNDDLAQYTAARLLHDAVVRACELAMRKTGIKNLSEDPYSDPQWVKADRTAKFGAELSFLFTVEAAITDELPNLEGSEIIEVANLQPNIGVELSDNIATTGESDPPNLIGATFLDVGVASETDSASALSIL